MNTEQSQLPDPNRLRQIAHVLDDYFAVPGTKIRFGLDALVGLIPGIGDTLMAAAGCYLVFEAARLGASKTILTRMIGNLALETLVGAVPIIGDLFDIAWKANLRNVALLDRYVTGKAAVRSEVASKKLLSVLALILVLFVVVIGTVSILIIGALIKAFN